MGGLFGGLLVIVEAIGGVVLTILIGGRAAWKENAEGFRFLFGSYITGSITGFLISKINGWYFDWRGDFKLSWFIGLTFVLFPIVATIITIILCSIRQEINKDKK